MSSQPNSKLDDRAFDQDRDAPDLNDAAIDETDANLDADLDAAAIEDMQRETGDLPQAVTESYGTGVHDQPGFAAGGRTLRDRMSDYNEASPVLTGGDIDANYEQANAVGDESVGGTAPTPDMDIVDELGAAVGLEMDDQAFLRTNEILEQRDDRRWELDPSSSEDYGDRRS